MRTQYLAWYDRIDRGPMYSDNAPSYPLAILPDWFIRTSRSESVRLAEIHTTRHMPVMGWSW